MNEASYPSLLKTFWIAPLGTQNEIDLKIFSLSRFS
jgi:hypothetical protein